MNNNQLTCWNARTGGLVIALALWTALLQVHMCNASYSCCSEERRGTVCTLAGSGTAISIDNPNAITAAINGPVAVALYPPHSIVVVGLNECRLRVIHHNGTVTTLAGGENAGSYKDSDDPLAARFDHPTGVCADSEGNLLLSDNYNHRIRTILRNGSVRTIAGNGNFGSADNADPLKAQFYNQHGIASITENGQHLIVIGGGYDQRVRVIYPNKTVSTLAGSGGIGYLMCVSEDNAHPLAARFCHPLGVAQDFDGNIIVAEWAAGRVRRVWRDDSRSGVTTIAGSGPIGLSGGSSIDSDNPFQASIFEPVGVAIDGAGNILVSTYGEHRVRSILINGSVRTLAGSGPSSSLTVNTPGSFVDNVPLRQARFFNPYYLAIDREGNVILADQLNNRVRMLCTNLPAATSNSLLLRSSTSFSTSIESRSDTISPEAATMPAPSPSEPRFVMWTGRTAAISISVSARAATHSTLSAASASPAASQSQSLRWQSSPPRSPISRLVSSEGVARAVVASGAAASALAGIAATTSMGHATRMGALMRSVECAFASGELDPPSVVELPLQWSIESQGGSLGSHAGSALLTSALLVVLPLLLCALVHAILSSCGASERPVLRSLQCNVLSRYCLLSMAFFLPNVLMSAVVVVGRGASSGAVVAAMCGATVPLLLGCVAGQRALAMDVEVVPLCGGKWELRNRPSSRAYVETFGNLVSGCRDPMPLIVRACFLEDAVASLVLSFLSGVSLSTARCEWVALAMLAVSALHLLYVVCVRPLRSRVESAMNCGLCAVQVVMAALCLAIASGADSSGGLLLSVLGVVAVVQNASFFAQAAILAASACVIESRKRHTLSCDIASVGDAMMAFADHHALLAAPDPLVVPPLMSST